jgi:hypothetical protein
LNKILKKFGISYQGTPYKKDAMMIQALEVINMQDEEDDDPFDVFGHGIKSYFTMIESMICVFFVASILVTPLCYFYYNGDAYEKA